MWIYRNKIRFYGEEVLATCPTPKLEDHPLSAVRDYLFIIFAATPPYRRTSLHPQPKDTPCRGDRMLTFVLVFYEYSEIQDFSFHSMKMSVILSVHYLTGSTTAMTGVCAALHLLSSSPHDGVLLNNLVVLLWVLEL